MLIHVTRFVNVQDRVAELVGFELRELQNRIRYGDGEAPMPIMEELRTMWLEDFVPTSGAVRDLYPELMAGCRDVAWEDVRPRLVESSQRIEVKVINGAARDALDYWDRPDGLSAIAIGGDKLSRGLTLEGLSVSYYLRASQMYDTLLQMGRWFGYRPGYVDLCRLYTTDELRDFYSHITMSTEELRQEFELMADRGMSPIDFGLRVRNHPAGLVITAANKMRNGTRMTVSYSADISETISFDRDPGVNRKNLDLLGRFITSLGSPRIDRLNNMVWSEVPGELIADLMGDITVHPGSRKARGEYIARYIRSQNATGGLVDWTVALISNQRNPSGEPVELAGLKVHPSQRSQHPPDDVEQDRVYRIRRLVSPTDEMLDLSREQRDWALERTVQQHLDHGESSRHREMPTRPSGPNIRRARDRRNGLLLLYPLQETDSAGTAVRGVRLELPRGREGHSG